LIVKGDNMSRLQWKISAALTDSADTTPEILWNGARFGMVHIPSASTITSLTYYVTPDPDGGAFTALNRNKSADGSLETVTQAVAADVAVPLPPELLGCRAFKVVADAAGSVVFSFQN
jgi:hypothetical protein